MKSRFLLTLCLVAIVALAFASIGVAYTASTENSGNNVASEYVVLEQQNYTFTSDYDVRFDTVVTEAGTAYQMRNVVQLVEIDHEMYYGKLLGADTLRATQVGSMYDGKVKVATAKMQGQWFTDYSDYYHSWRYILKIIGTEPGDVQYAYYDGSMDGDLVDWKILVPATLPATGYVEADALNIVEGVTYTTELYFAGIGKSSTGYFRSVDSTVVTSSDITVSPIYRVVTKEEASDPETNLRKNTLIDKDAGGEVIGQRFLYFISGEPLILPKNQFDNRSGFVFVGWRETAEQAKIYTPWYFFTKYTTSRTFEAQWEAEGSANLRSGNVALDEYSGNWTEWGDTGSGKYVVDSFAVTKMKEKFMVLVDSGYAASLSKYTIVTISASGVITYQTVASGDTIISSGYKIWNKDMSSGSEKVSQYSHGTGSKEFVVLVHPDYSTHLGDETVVRITDADTIAFDTYQGTPYIQYFLYNNTFTLPMSEFNKEGYKFAGWTVTGQTDRYGSVDQPLQNIAAVMEDITLTPKWVKLDGSEHAVKLTGYVKFVELTYYSYTDGDRYILPNNVFAPSYNLSDENFAGWLFIGWGVEKEGGKTVAQSIIMPCAKDGHIIYNGTIKFMFKSTPEQEGQS